MWALVTAGIGLATQMMKEDEKGAEGGAGSAALAAVQRFGQAEEVSRHKLIEPSEATTTKETAEILSRTMAAIESNGPNAMQEVARMLAQDSLRTTGGRIPEEPMIQPQQPAVQQVEAVELEELEEKEEKYEEPFVSQRSLYG